MNGHRDTIVVVDDDIIDVQESYEELLSDEGFRVRCFETLMQHHHYAPICSYLERHPGVIVVIASAVSRTFAEGVRDDVLQQMPEAMVKIAEYPTFENLLNVLSANSKT